VAVASSPRAGSTFHCLLKGRFLRAVPELRADMVAISPEVGLALTFVFTLFCSQNTNNATSPP
jgi:hypothetical protein